MRLFSKQLGLKLCIGLTSAALVAGTANGLASQAAKPREASIAVAPVAAITNSPSVVGISDSALYFASDEDIARTLDEMLQLGVQNVRIQIPWAGVEIARDVYFWERIDKQVEAAAARNMGVLGVLNQTPRWIADDLAGHPDPTEFAQFAADVAARYKGRVSAYEIWNEPNSIQFFDPIDPAAYAELLKSAYQGIKAVDGSIIVVGGVVGSVIGQGRVVLNPVEFIDQKLRACAAGSFDALSFHPYQYTLMFSQGADQIQSPLRQIDDIRRLLEQAGLPTMPIWATEYGLPTNEVSPEQQAAFIDDFLRAWQDVAYAGPAFIYTTRDFAEGSPNDQDNFGIFYANWVAKPAAQVIEDFIDSLQPRHPVRDAIRAALRALAQLTGDVIEAAVAATKFVVDAVIDVAEFVARATVAVITEVVKIGVGAIRVTVDAVRNVVQAITDCLSPGQAPPTSRSTVEQSVDVTAPESAPAPADTAAATITDETSDLRPASDASDVGTARVRRESSDISTDPDVSEVKDVTDVTDTDSATAADDEDAADPDVTEDKTTSAVKPPAVSRDESVEDRATDAPGEAADDGSSSDDGGSAEE
jgi:hypothetical protein